MNGTEKTLTNSHCTTITRLNKDHVTIIYLIILHHYNLNNNHKTELPYNCKTISNGKGVIIKKIDNLPEDLQKIIYQYLKIVSE